MSEALERIAQPPSSPFSEQKCKAPSSGRLRERSDSRRVRWPRRSGCRTDRSARTLLRALGSAVHALSPDVCAVLLDIAGRHGSACATTLAIMEQSRPGTATLVATWGPARLSLSCRTSAARAPARRFAVTPLIRRHRSPPYRRRRVS